MSQNDLFRDLPLRTGDCNLNPNARGIMIGTGVMPVGSPIQLSQELADRIRSLPEDQQAAVCMRVVALAEQGVKFT